MTNISIKTVTASQCDDNSVSVQPLTLRRFGIELRRMVSADKEAVRIGRNKDFVRNNHVYREIISEEAQDKWFEEMNRKEHYVLIISYKGKSIGVVILKDIPENIESSTCGAFIWDEEYIATKIPILSVLMALDFAYYTCGVKWMESVVLKHNIAAIKMNKFFGFTFHERDQDSFLITMDRASYVQQRERLNWFAKRAVKNPDEHELRIFGSKTPLNHDKLNALLGD
ncbi:MAG: GNAT family N-acetyltransferase [Turneriella sp.]